ncbi:F-box/FBD/LRR-repeat protein At1g13570-like [Rutidosis leptorrhynchoides]|uniref:F-box/FBD/LRR-repeat protein At1g13570-like n=1 Tax=Rutidosis leptorrhynchoides TaxID=125765 RepID=UPI003A9A5C90
MMSTICAPTEAQVDISNRKSRFMELIQGTRDDSNLSTKDDDIISSMPNIVITNIMNRLPIQDAIRTSILARNWRLKWTTLTQLVFDKDFVQYLGERQEKQDNVGDDNWYDEKNISGLFPHLMGPITKFVLTIPYGKVLDVKDFYDWVMFLSRKGIMEFTLENNNKETVELPTSIFSCRNLTHLKLSNCHFPAAPPSFRGFQNLLSLDVSQVTFASGFCDVITMSPLLEILKICDDEEPVPKVNLVDILKLKNLKVVSLPLYAIDSMEITNSLIVHGGPFLPNLEELFLSLAYFEGGVDVEEVISGKLLCDSFSRIKSLTLRYFDFDCSVMSPFVYEIIWGLPNLQTLTIYGSSDYEDRSLELCTSMGQLQLLNVVLEYFEGSKYELFFIKKLLACTPLLKKITIRPARYRHFDGHEEKFMVAKELLMFERASTIAKVDLDMS